MADTDDTLSRSDYALYLIDELASLLTHTNPADWPEQQIRVFRRRLEEINTTTAGAAS